MTEALSGTATEDSLEHESPKPSGLEVDVAEARRRLLRSTGMLLLASLYFIWSVDDLVFRLGMGMLTAAGLLRFYREWRLPDRILQPTLRETVARVLESDEPDRDTARPELLVHLEEDLDRVSRTGSFFRRHRVSVGRISYALGTVGWLSFSGAVLALGQGVLPAITGVVMGGVFGGALLFMEREEQRREEAERLLRERLRTISQVLPAGAEEEAKVGISS